MASWNTPIERASAPISSPRSLYGIDTRGSPAATASVTRVISASGCATRAQIISAPTAASMTAKRGEHAQPQAVVVDAAVDLRVDRAWRALA